MTDYCFACGGDHSYQECPSLQPPKPPSMSTTPEERSRSSLPPTQYEEMYGEGAEGLLLDVLDRSDEFNEDQRNLARLILSGSETISSLDAADRERLDVIGRQLAQLEPREEPIPEKPIRPAYVRTREEMENF